MGVVSYRELDVWRVSMDLCLIVYRLSSSSPPDERFGLTSQVRRSSTAIAANIAEGFGRGTKADFARFVRIARGSLMETETHIELAQRLDYIQSDDAQRATDECDRISRMLHRLHGSLTQHEAPGTRHA